jgi:hypothetical protein
MKASIVSLILSAVLGCTAARAQVIRAPFSLEDYFEATGWMGEGSRGTILIKIDENYTRKPRPGDNDGKCIRFSWEPRASSWAGLYWQSPAGNWGQQPGKSVVGATRVTFWAAGETGSEIVEFKAGGLRTTTMPYKDSFAVTLGAVKLTTGWRRYELGLKGQNLSSTIGAFGWVARKSNNLGTTTFYLDGIRYE